MKIAFLSDIHANLTALKAVHEDMKQHGVEMFIVVGDVIDYGVNVNECMEYLILMSQEMSMHVIKGNHEMTLLDDTELERFAKQRGIDAHMYTRSVIKTEHVEFIKTWPEMITLDELCIHHGNIKSAWTPGYIDALSMLPQGCSVLVTGHAHVPMMMSYNGKMLVNPGSVGQPRNRDSRSHYAIYEDGSVTFRRVKYDIEKEQSYFGDKVDEYYKNRLTQGI